MTSFIDIRVDSTINPMFIKANSFLLDKNKEQFLELDYKDKVKLLEDLWLTEYKAKLIKDELTFSKIEFIDSRSMTMFQLRWS